MRDDQRAAMYRRQAETALARIDATQRLIAALPDRLAAAGVTLGTPSTALLFAAWLLGRPHLDTDLVVAARSFALEHRGTEHFEDVRFWPTS